MQRTMEIFGYLRSDIQQPSQVHKDKAEVVLEDLSQAIDYRKYVKSITSKF